MEEEQSHMTEMIYDLALEIIFLLTGEKHAAVKMASIEGLLQGMYPPLPVGDSFRLAPITNPPSHFQIPKRVNRKILEVTGKIMELLAGEVSGAGDSGTLGKNAFLDEAMEDRPPLKCLGRTQKKTLQERHPDPLYAKDSTQEEDEEDAIYQDHVDDELIVKEVKVEDMEPYVRGDEWVSDEETSTTQNDYIALHHYQGEKLLNVKPEAKVLVRAGEQSKEEVITSNLCTDWALAQSFREPPFGISNVQMQRENLILESSHIHNLPSTPTQKIFSCSECGKSFTKKFSFITHKRIHTGEKPYSCSVCGKCFSQKPHLTSHQRVHTGEKPFSCSECRKCFSEKTSLIKHEQVHSGEKPYSCPVCGKSFSRKFSYITHRRIHTGEKPYSCAECGRCFSQRAHLLGHQRVHTGEKPYFCSECGKHFTHKSNFIRHKHAYTVNDPY